MSGVRQVLAEHFVMWHDLPGERIAGEWRCACGLKFGFSDSAIEHQAERILDARLAAAERILAAPLAAADRDAALRERIEALAAEWERVGAVLSGERAEAVGDAASDLRAALDKSPADGDV